MSISNLNVNLNLTLYACKDLLSKQNGNYEEYLVKTIEDLNTRIYKILQNYSYQDFVLEDRISETQTIQQSRVNKLFNFVRQKKPEINNLSTFHYSIGSRVLVENGIAMINMPFSEKYDTTNTKLAFYFSKEEDDGPNIEGAKKIKKKEKYVFDFNKLNNFIVEEIISFKSTKDQRNICVLQRRFNVILNKDKFWRNCEIYKTMNTVFKSRILEATSRNFYNENYKKNELFKCALKISGITFLIYETIHLAPGILAAIKNPKLFEGRNIFQYSSDRWKVFFNGMGFEKTGVFYEDEYGILCEEMRLVHLIPMGPVGTHFRENLPVYLVGAFLSTLMGSIAYAEKIQKFFIKTYGNFREERMDEIDKINHFSRELSDLPVDVIDNKKILKPVLTPCGLHDFDAISKEIRNFGRCRFHNRWFSMLEVRVDKDNFLRNRKNISWQAKILKNTEIGKFI